MSDRIPARFFFENGYWPSTAPIFGVPHTLLAGKNLWVRGKGLLITSKGFGGSVASSGGVNPLLNVASTYGGLSGGGSIVQAFGNGIYFFAGSGFARVGGVTLGAVQGGSVTIYTGSSAVAAGLLPPGAPTIADSGVAGHNNGAYSIAVTGIRSLTGGESSVSAPSNVISVTNHGINITALPGLPAGANKIGIYATKRGFGSIGPYFHLYDTTIPTLPYTIQVPNDTTPGWIDAQLGDLAPQTFSVPPTCGFCFAINSVIVAAGCYGGAGLSPSYPNKPEAYPVSFVLFIPGGGTITAVKGSGVEGRVLVCTASSVNLVSASQSTISPLNVYPIWPTTGVVSANQIATVGGEIYAWLGTRGPVRDRYSLGGSSYRDPNDEATSFAAPVMQFFAANGYAAGNVVVCYDPASDSVFYVNGSIGISYNRYLAQWNTPMDMPASIVTAVTDTVNGRALFSDSAGNLYTPETGGGTGWSLVSQFQAGDFAAFGKTFIGAESIADVAHRLDIYSDLNLSTSNAQGTNISQGANQTGQFKHLDIQEIHSFAIGMSGSDAGGKQVVGAEGLFIEHPVRI